MDADGWIQRRATKRRCQPSSVSGCTRNTDQRARGSSRLNAAKQCTVTGLQAAPWMLAAQDRELAAQYQDLDLPGFRRAEAEHDQLEATAQRQVDERPDHTSAKEGEQARTHPSLRQTGLLVTAPTDFWHPTSKRCAADDLVESFGDGGSGGALLF